MRKIEYPDNCEELKQEYLSCFNLHLLQQNWLKLRSSDYLLKSTFPVNVIRILLANYHRLVKYYLTFTKKILAHPFYSTPYKKWLVEQLKDLFAYDNGYQGDIASFFMRYSDKLGISVCNYCETAHINVYTFDSEKEGLEFLNNASEEELEDRLKIFNKKSLREIKDYGEIKSIDDFQSEGINRGWWRKPDKLRAIFPKIQNKNHFDIDHALDKATCPIVALSLFNFVPSCQVCNQRLKRSWLLGDRKRRIPKTHMSPSSATYDFDEKVKFVVDPILKPDDSIPSAADAIKEREYFELDFDVKDQDFEDFIELFHLRERYRYHKTEGLYWIQLKERYTDGHIDLMVSGLDMPEFTADRIKEDLFREEYDGIRNPCFQKLKRDCLNQ